MIWNRVERRMLRNPLRRRGSRTDCPVAFDHHSELLGCQRRENKRLISARLAKVRRNVSVSPCFESIDRPGIRSGKRSHIHELQCEATVSKRERSVLTRVNRKTSLFPVSLARHDFYCGSLSIHRLPATTYLSFLFFTLFPK